MHNPIHVLVHGSWFMVHGSWFMVHGSWLKVKGYFWLRLHLGNKNKNVFILYSAWFTLPLQQKIIYKVYIIWEKLH